MHVQSSSQAIHHIFIYELSQQMRALHIGAPESLPADGVIYTKRKKLMALIL
jgi:hypothetical protein